MLKSERSKGGAEMEGQPAFLVTILMIVAILQIQTLEHRPLVPSDLLAHTACAGVDLNVGCAPSEVTDEATSSP
jgi:hypothetical protein